MTFISILLPGRPIKENILLVWLIYLLENSLHRNKRQNIAKKDRRTIDLSKTVKITKRIQ